MSVCANCGHENRRGAKFCEECGFPFRDTLAKEQRKTVTILFCDLEDSTALGEQLDPERLSALLARYFERMRRIVERYGGTVEKFIGDAVMAVFGVPVVHEDDALRAAHSALAMRDALTELGVQGRIGVMTGEVVTGTEGWLAGDAVNVAARLEQAAQPGEVLLGEPTLALVREAVEVELATIVGDAGLGKSRLAACRLLDEQGEKTLLSTAAGRLAQALYALDRLDEADDWAGRAAEAGASDDPATQMLVRQVRAKVLARRGESAEAEPLAREAVAVGQGTDMINMQGDAYMDLGEVLLLSGKREEALAVLEYAVDRYERKGNLVSTGRAQARLAEISEARAPQT